MVAHPVKIVNNTGTAISNYQQMVVAPMCNNCANASVSNVFWAYDPAGASIIPSWLESQVGSTVAPTNTKSGSLIYWLNIAGTISAGATQTVYMIFADRGATVWDGTLTGIAPQWTSTYGQYDNGTAVFNVYLNFKGTTLPSGYLSAKSSDGTFTVNNGLIMGTSTLVSPSYSYFVSTSLYSPQLVEYYLASIIANPNKAGIIGTDLGFSSTTSPVPNNNYGSSSFYGCGIGSGVGNFIYMIFDNGLISSINGTFVTGIYTTNINPLQYYLNYNLLTSTTIAITTNLYLLLGIFSNGTQAASPQPENILVYWFRTRTNLSNGMPAVLF